MVTRSKTTHWVVFELRSIPHLYGFAKKRTPHEGVFFFLVDPRGIEPIANILQVLIFQGFLCLLLNLLLNKLIKIIINTVGDFYFFR